MEKKVPFFEAWTLVLMLEERRQLLNRSLGKNLTPSPWMPRPYPPRPGRRSWKPRPGPSPQSASVGSVLWPPRASTSLRRRCSCATRTPVGRSPLAGASCT